MVAGTVSVPPSEAADEVVTTIDRLLGEGCIGTAAAPRMCGSVRGGKSIHPSTVGRWVLNGIKLADGRTVKLEAFKSGNQFVTSRAAVVRFLAAQQQTAAPTGDAAAGVRAPAKRNRASEAAARELAAMGC